VESRDLGNHVDVACCRPADVCTRSRRGIPRKPHHSIAQRVIMLRVARDSRQGQSPGQPLRVANCPAPRRCCWGQVGGSNRANTGTRCSDHVPGLSPKEAATADLVNCKSGGAVVSSRTWLLQRVTDGSIFRIYSCLLPMVRPVNEQNVLKH
jgi:hypothetical protein